MYRLQVLIAAAALACSGRSSHFRVQVASLANAGEGSVPTVTMQAGQTRFLQFMLVGEVPESVTFSASDLPSYSTLNGPLLTLSPRRPDAGEKVVTVTATAGSESASTSLRIVVERGNAVPTWSVGHWLIGDDAPENHGLHHMGNCPGPWCTLIGTPRLYFDVNDPDGDAINIDVEVVVRGQPFSGKPTHVAVKPGDWRSDPGWWNNIFFEVPLTGLTADRSYEFAIRITDEYGALAAILTTGPADGWLHSWGLPFEFDLGPCTSQHCACVPSANFCDRGAECCGGACDPPPQLGGFMAGTCR